jgi:hypothetical protein
MSSKPFLVRSGNKVIDPPFAKKRVELFVVSAAPNNFYLCWDLGLAKTKNYSTVTCKINSTKEFEQHDTVTGILDLTGDYPLLKSTGVVKYGEKKKEELKQKCELRLRMEGISVGQILQDRPIVFVD